MYVKKETEYQNNPVIIKTLEVLTGGATIDNSDFNTALVSELKAGAIVGEDSNGLFHLIKTVLIVTGGSASAPRINSTHAFIVGDFISDGIVALEIASITVGDDYDTLGFTTGSLEVSTEDTLLYQATAENLTTQGKVATATVQDTVGDYLTVTIPVVSGPAKFNGISLTISQATDDVLAVSFDDGVLEISLADTTAANNNIAAVQAAIRALGTVDGFDLSAVVVSEVDWDDKQTGATLTTATDLFDGGVDSTAGGNVVMIYTPEGITVNPVNLTVANQTAGVLVRGTVNQANMDYPVDATIKALLPLIRFENPS